MKIILEVLIVLYRSVYGISFDVYSKDERISNGVTEILIHSSLRWFSQLDRVSGNPLTKRIYINRLKGVTERIPRNRKTF